MALVLSSDSLKFGLVIVAATLLSSCLSAPPPKRDQAPDPWWFDPCNSDIPRLRHSRSATATENRVKYQIKIFIQHIRESMKNMNKLYGNNKHAELRPTPTGKLSWLRIKKMTNELKKAQVQKKGLDKYQEQLQYFAGTLEVLRNIQIKNHEASFDEGERRNIFLNISFDMKQLLCEVYEEQKDRTVVPKRIPLSKMKIPLKKPLDVTAAHLVDINFFKKAISFFKKSQNLLFKNSKVKKNKSAVKNRNRSSRT